MPKAGLAIVLVFAFGKMLEVDIVVDIAPNGDEVWPNGEPVVAVLDWNAEVAEPKAGGDVPNAPVGCELPNRRPVDCDGVETDTVLPNGFFFSFSGFGLPPRLHMEAIEKPNADCCCCG